jgi:hypothetical protein
MGNGAGGEAIVSGNASSFTNHVGAGRATVFIAQSPPPQPIVQYKLTAIKAAEVMTWR